MFARPFRGTLLALLLLSSASTRAEAAVYGGTIKAFSPETGVLVLEYRGDRTKAFQLKSGTEIKLDGRRTRRESLKAGMRVTVTTTRSGTVTRVSARKGASDSSKPAPETATPAKTNTPPQRSAPRRSNRPSTANAAAGGEWPMFRGAERDNVSTETGLLDEWPPGGPRLLWTARNLGEGYSSVTVAGGKIFTMGTRNGKEAVFALDLDSGRELWATPNGDIRQDGTGNGPRGTPSTDGDSVYALGANGDLQCLDANTGRPNWGGNILREFGGNNIGWGISESVLIDGDHIICTPGGRRATLAALDKRSGNTVWTSVVPGNPQAGYASPIVADAPGGKQYVAFTSRAVVGIDAGNGRFLWQENSSANGTANCSTPLYHDGYVFSASGYGTGGTLVKLAGNRAERVYHTDDMKNHHGGMVIVDGHLYGSNDPGILTCIELAGGDVKWRDRSVGKGSVTFADGHIYLRSERGPVALVEATPDGYREKGRFDQPNRSNRNAWAHPVVAAGKLFLRDQDLLLCYDLKAGN